MSCSKPLPPFTFDFLGYLNRDQLERFSIVCRPLKNIIDRYFHSKPYRIFNRLEIRGGSYALVHRYNAQWHPNRDDYTVQQFLAGQKCSFDKSKPHQNDYTYYSFSDMRPYLGPTVRINLTIIDVAKDSIYSPEHITEMESIAYLWRNGKISILCFDSFDDDGNRFVIGAEFEDFQPILNSPTILQCRELSMHNANFSFKDYKVLYSVKFFDINYYDENEIDPSYWKEFLEQPGVKPIVVLKYYHHEHAVNVVECLKKAFSSAVVPSDFKIVFHFGEDPLTEFRETNKISGEILELKKGLPTNWEGINFDENLFYTLERSSI